jgi:hypothetical protein
MVLGALIAGFALAAPMAHAQSFSLAAVDRGLYDPNGTRDPNNDSYFVGTIGGGVFNDFFVFDLGGVNGTITSAQLQLFEPDGGYSSDLASETYDVGSVSTPIATLIATQTGAAGLAIRDDLAAGTLYGTVTTTAADDGTVITITLNAAALAALNASENMQIAFGGTLPGATGDEFIFGGSDNHGTPNPGDGHVVLALEVTPVGATTPEPATWALMILAFVGLGFTARRRTVRA